MKKGQIFSADFILSLFLFLIVISISVLVWQSSRLQIERYERNNEMESIVLSVSNLLVKTPGNPENWEELGFDEINSIGFAESDHILNNEKISKFYNMNSTYENTTGLLGASRYGFYLTITNMTDDKIFLDGKAGFGIEPPTTATDIHSIRRVCLLNEPEQIIFLKIILWR